MRELYKQAKKRYRVPDTAHDCPILRIGVMHDRDYWLIIECKENTLLQELDQFLRDIWLECCGHMSIFNTNVHPRHPTPQTHVR